MPNLNSLTAKSCVKIWLMYISSLIYMSDIFTMSLFHLKFRICSEKKHLDRKFLTIFCPNTLNYIYFFLMDKIALAPPLAGFTN